MPRALRSAAKLQKALAVVPLPAAAEESRCDIALVLSPDVLGLVLKRLSYEDLVNLPRVACFSRSWADAVAEIFDAGAIVAGVTPVELRKLKTIARNLDLSFLRKDFCENGQLLLGHFDMEGYFDEDELEEMGHDKMGRVLNAMAIAFKNEFDLDGVDEALAMLFDAVATAYKKFLVVKACEAKALLVSNANAPSINPWLEKCCVSKVVDVLWHTHLMRPEHYLETCSALLGHVGVIDHDPGYVSPCVVARSTFFDKQQRLYSQQNRCLYGSSGVDYTMIGSMEYIVILRDTEEWLEMAFEDDLYHDDMECG